MPMPNYFRILAYVLLFLIVIGFLAVVLMLGVNGARAQEIPRCDKHDALLARLANVFQEHVVLQGVATDNAGTPVAIVEMTAANSGTWTAVMTDPTGNACIMANGGRFKMMEKGA